MGTFSFLVSFFFFCHFSTIQAALIHSNGFLSFHRRKVCALARRMPQVRMVMWLRNVGYFFPPRGTWIRCVRPPSLSSGTPFFPCKFTLQNIFNSDELLCRVFHVSDSGLPPEKRRDRLLNRVHHSELLVGLASRLNADLFFFLWFPMKGLFFDVVDAGYPFGFCQFLNIHPAPFFFRSDCPTVRALC